MVSCETCGGDDFETYAGFMYCATCNTQSQVRLEFNGFLMRSSPSEVHEQEYEYQEADTVRRHKTKKSQSKKKENEHDDGVWTSWEAFNHILFGMTREMERAFSLPPEFQALVLKLWASYLNACRVAFISRHHEAMPQLQFNFKHRDARVMYDLDMDAISSKRSQRSKSVCSASSKTSNTSVSSDSRRSLAKKRSKIISSEYAEHLSQSMASVSSLQDETLESLGRSDLSDMSTDNEGASSSDETLMRCFKNMFSKKNFKAYKTSIKSREHRIRANDLAKKNIRFMAKNKLLSIIHLALLMMGSEIQLSDLLRLIREAHLSYAKVTQFLPKDYKFSKNDCTYIDVISDVLMPTHLSQRKISRQLANLLGIELIQTPDMKSLVKRYCVELNLPEEIVKLSQAVCRKVAPDILRPQLKKQFPCCEAQAMASIIFVMKLLFGLNDKTEYFLSDLATYSNKINEKRTESSVLFVFEDWQKFIECRKAVLIEFHYPTHEQLNNDALISSKKFLHMLYEESKDEHRRERFLPYPKYYTDENFTEALKDILDHLTEPMEIQSIEFRPSLTPQSSYIKSIISNIRETDENPARQKTENVEVPEEILTKSFTDASIDFVYAPEKYLEALRSSDLKQPLDLRFYVDSYLNTNLSGGPSSSACHDKSDILLNCSSKYWIFHSSGQNLENFKESVLENTPQSFQWLMTECARMLEMNIRDLYDDLILVENVFSNG
ncbi:hypothetical protein RUM44_007905 [Polyplax serrata]|uniref:Rrn7/TAF1B C-terminal cyclin domain-containing protein n=1 Tax=Polyplax serrata TaxID=468196 RepID=A0ABR1B7E4_POLSC